MRMPLSLYACCGNSMEGSSHQLRLTKLAVLEQALRDPRLFTKKIDGVTFSV